jgi:hypothetical protein
VLEIFLQDRRHEGVHNDFSEYDLGPRPASKRDGNARRPTGSS